MSKIRSKRIKLNEIDFARTKNKKNSYYKITYKSMLETKISFSYTGNYITTLLLTFCF